jgi:hypothetical protein
MIRFRAGHAPCANRQRRQSEKKPIECLIWRLRFERGSMLFAPIPDALRTNSLIGADNAIDGMALEQLLTGIL